MDHEKMQTAIRELQDAMVVMAHLEKQLVVFLFRLDDQATLTSTLN